MDWQSDEVLSYNYFYPIPTNKRAGKADFKFTVSQNALFDECLLLSGCQDINLS